MPDNDGQSGNRKPPTQRPSSKGPGAGRPPPGGFKGSSHFESPAARPTVEIPSLAGARPVPRTSAPSVVSVVPAPVPNAAKPQRPAAARATRPMIKRPAPRGASKEAKAGAALLRSAFSTEEPTKFDTVMGRTARPVRPEDDDDEATVAAEHFDGITPAASVTRTDGLAVQAPFQNREGRRSARAYELAIDQFAVGHNPRYEAQSDGPLGHLFVSDVTAAMGVGVPHWLAGEVLSLPRTCLWMRQHAGARGWVKMAAVRAMEAAAQGKPVVVVPKNLRIALLGMLRPSSGPRGEPLVAAAGRVRGNRLSLQEALGTSAVDFYSHQ